ncbi:MAG: PBP1A family penicillin-binding protein [Desulfosarcina sp.]|nr:PBP1A family penicillin-binding protein [Desulfobacterales bacterium]
MGTTGLGLYGRVLYRQVEERFAGRRWLIPSRVFSDVTLLYPGLSINRPALLRKLYRLDYRPVDHPLRRKGEMRVRGDGIDIFLHDLQIPDQHRPGFPVCLRLQDGQIAALEPLDQRGDLLSVLTLEPEELALFFGPEREKRILVAVDQLPPHLIHAVLAAEDSRFYAHHGLDLRGIARALVTNVRHLAVRQGGSTITQQLAKNFFLTPERTLRRKLKEVLLALVIEWRYAKDEILEMYLNEIYWGQDGSVSVNGVGEAADFYFGKPPEALTLGEAAALAGLIKSPNAYSPYRDPDRCRRRRNAVLKAMRVNGWLDKIALARGQAEPLAPRAQIRQWRRTPYFIDYLQGQLAALYEPEALASLGLAIHTTLDPLVQEAAETALTNGLKRLETLYPTLRRQDPLRQLQGAVVVMKPTSGAILAMVGGRDYRHSQFNRISQARRQAGSTFKVFTYLAGLDDFTPISILSNAARTYHVDGQDWQPRNDTANDVPRVSLREALARSINRATVDLAMRVGMEKVADTARRFRFSSQLQPFPSLALGAVDVYPLELARAYCVFAAAGTQPFPLGLRAVFDDRGRLIEHRPMRLKRIISPARAFLIDAMLQSAVRLGTGRALAGWGINFPVAGKTGTTNNYRDAWFVGFTPDLLALVWVGFDNGDSLQVSGSQAALPIWAEIMRAIPHQVSGAAFTPPPTVVKHTICTRDGFPDVSGDCPETGEEWFQVDNVPEDDPILVKAQSSWYRWWHRLKGENHEP